MTDTMLIAIIVVQLAMIGVGIWTIPSIGSTAARWIFGLLVCPLLAAAVFWVSEPHFLFNDFRKAYYPAAVAVLDRPDALWPLIEKIQFVNLPVVAYLFAPLGLVSFKLSAAAFFVAGVAATLLAWRELVRLLPMAGHDRLVLLLLIAANGPLLYSLKEGNTSHFVLLALVVSLSLLHQQKSVLAGLLLGVCALIKLPLLIFAPYFLLRRNWSALAGFTGLLAGAGLLSIVIFGWEFNARWFELCVIQFSRNPIAAFNVQSIPSFLLRLQAGDALLRDWSGQVVPFVQRFSATAAALSMVAAAVLIGMRRPQTQLDDRWLNYEFALVTCLAIVTSPMSWTHYYCWLLLPAALFLSAESVIASTATSRRMAWAAILLVTPAVGIADFGGNVISAIYLKLAISHYLFGGLIWTGLLIWALARLAPSASRLERAPSN